MKKIFTLILGASMVLSLEAQLPKWVISPQNDTLYIKVDNKLIQGEADGKSSIWTMDGLELFTTDDVISPFRDDVATIISRGQSYITGLIDEKGNFTTIPKMKVAYDRPYFENDYILCVDNDKYVYIKKDGNKATFPEVIKGYPFHKGYASFFTYENLEKKKDPHYGYQRADGQPIIYVISENNNQKSIDVKDLSFVSSIGPNGKGVGIIKNKIYWFDPISEIFEPLIWGEEELDKKRQLTLNGDYTQYFMNLPQDTVVINAKYGKNQYASLKFDKELIPTVFTFGDKEYIFQEMSPEEFNYNYTIKENQKDGKYGLSLNSKAALPEQFEKVGIKYGNKAFVKKNGKWGIVEIIPNVEYTLKLNKGEDIAFRHQKFDTQIRLDLPAAISSKEVRINIPEETGCIIDKTSRESKDTESGNFVTYNCVLSIPPSLPDTVTTITYQPIDITYDGIELFQVPISIKAWHYKYYNVDPIESETSISNGVASFTLNINAQKNAGESDYPFEVRIEADSISVEYEKISETRYKCFVSNLQEGDNSLNIFITEKGCPSSVFPFEITYTKPVPKKKKKEEVIIRKKDPILKTKQPRLEL